MIDRRISLHRTFMKMLPQHNLGMIGQPVRILSDYKYADGLDEYDQVSSIFDFPSKSEARKDMLKVCNHLESKMFGKVSDQD